MQSERTEVSQNSLPRNRQINSSDSAQYGECCHGEHASTPLVHEGDSSLHHPVDDIDASYSVSSPVSPNLSLQRLGSKRSDRSAPSVDRISQYEEAAIGSLRKPEVFGFRVILTRGGGGSGQSIEAFPSGATYRNCILFYPMLILRRGADSHFVASSTFFTVVSEPRQPPIS
jgi:hypothetical protein